MEEKKLEAELKLVAKQFGDRLGLSWFKALREEFKKPYWHSVSCKKKSHTLIHFSPVVCEADEVCE